MGGIASHRGIPKRTVGWTAGEGVCAGRDFVVAAGAADPGQYAGSVRTLRVVASKLQGFNRGLSLGVTPIHVDLHLVVGAEWPDREDVHAAHSLQVE